MDAHERIAVALDVDDLEHAVALAAALKGHVGWFKVGLELFSAYGPEAVAAVRPYGPVFLDVKLHDIPTTVERAAARLAALDVGLVTVHATGGTAMVAAAAHGFGDATRVLAVTVLTSLSPEDLDAVGLPSVGHPPVLAKLAVDAGVGGVVCAPGQAAQIRAAVGEQPWIVTPGVRLAASSSDDHAAAMTPAAAMTAGANLVVVGRPITRADDPAAAAGRIAADIAAAD